MDSRKKVRLSGILLLTGMCSGIFSVAPAIDSQKYLTAAAENSNQVILAAIFQFVLSLTYMGTAILLYPIVKRLDPGLSIGFLSFRVMAATLSVMGTILLLSILALSQANVQNPVPGGTLALELLGNVLKASRDSINHIFMILALCSGNFLFYLLLFKSKLIPQWLSVWGLIGVLLSVAASILVLFQKIEIITSEYLALNIPIAIHELALGIWLTVKGFGGSNAPPRVKGNNKSTR